ncbi:TRAP transporter small permease subunit [Arthrobacter gengyunqii]|uniref:TRAP transporter small permease subunit n=1 Tax=Arthrobacter gengyunqii TaxID=2886940 RepID=A0A9X1S594_9MICC|nr:TRAP transporter small permease subunit [Arthrobacter gengyunqii]MCC3269170.1 TRAP transporter small permease subunit [Arthrobacter gengyunqii]UOY94870.1 TRAP transporter small permease subunit [Arthrobacter gengyunqii]
MAKKVIGNHEKALKTISQYLDTVDRGLSAMLISAMAVMLMAALVQVGARHLTTETVIGPDEIARYMMTGSTFLAIPVLARRRNHIAVDALAHYLPRGAKIWLQRLLLTVELVFLVIFACLAIEVFLASNEAGQRSVGLGIPLSWPLFPVVAGATIGAAVTAALLLESILKTGQPSVAELEEQVDVGGMKP